MHTLLSTAILAMALVLPSVDACNFHMRRNTSDADGTIYSNPHFGRKQLLRRAEEKVIDFEYVNSFDWHTIKPEYMTCHTGTRQSPINLQTAQGLATTHAPSFAGYAATGNVTGTFSNWGFGPSFTLDMPVANDVTSLPAMTFDDQTVYLSGWHIHYPSEHLVDGVRSRAEMHMVHVNAAGEPASVVGMRIEPSKTTMSQFFAQMPQPLIRPPGEPAAPAAVPAAPAAPAAAPAAPAAPAAAIQGVPMDHTLAVAEVGHVMQFWTYMGSLTTPPCSEGLRWYVPQMTLKVSEAQMVQMLEAGRFSHRVEQVVWNQQINV